MRADRTGPAFVGRRRELATLRRLIRNARVLTLTGAGGIGKTRLAQRIAGARGADVVAWVDLAALRDGNDVAPAVERALGVTGDGTLRQEMIPMSLVRRDVRVVLDNCEHLLVASADAARLVLAISPRWSVLATSRRALALESEIVWRVPALALPTTDDESAATADAFQLFVQRACEARPSLVLRDQAYADIAWVCRRLDGVPLAIELASARVRHMSLAELRARLDVLPAVARIDDDDRHVSMEHAVEWSYGLLSERDREVFQRLAVFATDFDLAAAEAVAGDGSAGVVTSITELVDRSLVDFLASVERYRMLEPIRQSAERRLRESGELDLTAERCARHFHQRYVERRAPESPSRELDATMRRDFHNVAAVLPWAIRTRPTHAVRLLERYVASRWTAVPVHLSVLATWLTRALDAHPHRDATRAGGLLALANLTADLQRGEVAVGEAAEEALAVALELGDRHLESRARGTRATAALRRGEIERARALYDEALPLLSPRSRAFALSVRAVLAQQLGDPVASSADLAAAFAAWDGQPGHPATERSLTHYCAADVAFRRGDHALAASHLREAVAIRRAASEPQEAGPFEMLAHLTARAGDAPSALRLAGFAERLGRESGLWPARFLALSDRSWFAAAERAVGDAADRLRREGERWTEPQAIAYALDEGDGVALSLRERSVASLVASGLTDKEIAARLRISVRTAENHVQHVREKLGLRSRGQIGHWVAQRESVATASRRPLLP